MSILRNLSLWLAALLVVWLFSVFAAPNIDDYVFSIMMYAGINVILAVSLNLVNGFTGQFSMGHAGFMSVGGYTAAYLTSQLQLSHPELFASPVLSALVFVAALVAGGLAAALVGYGVG